MRTIIKKKLFLTTGAVEMTEIAEESLAQDAKRCVFYVENVEVRDVKNTEIEESLCVFE